MAKFCAWCGKPTEEEDVFCAFCGKRADGSDMPVPTAAQVPQPPVTPAAPPPIWQQPETCDAPTVHEPRRPQTPPQQWQSPPPAPPQKRGGKAGLIIGIAAAVVVIAAVLVGGFVWPGFFRNRDKDETPEIPKQTEAPSSTKEPKETDAPKPTDTPEPTEPPYVNTFTDVKEGDWYYDAVLWAGKSGIVSGTEFQPGEPTNRGQALTFLWRAAGKPAPTLKVSPYTDVKADDWYFEPVLWGFENGVISTATDGQFHADGTLTRAQAITFLCRARAGSPQSSERSFADVRADDWYFDTANWALKNGIVGRGTTWRFQPDETVTRAQFVTFLHRAYDPDAKKADGSAPTGESFRDLGMDADDVDNFGPKGFLTVTDNGTPVSFTAAVTDYRVFEADDGFPAYDGFEWRVMSIQVTYVPVAGDDSDIHWYVEMTDYYNVRLREDSTVRDENGVRTYAVVSDGQLKECALWYSRTDTNAGILYTFTVQTPRDYDGVVVGFFNAAIDNSPTYINEFYTDTTDFALFRMYNLS